MKKVFLCEIDKLYSRERNIKAINYKVLFVVKRNFILFVTIKPTLYIQDFNGTAKKSEDSRNEITF